MTGVAPGPLNGMYVPMRAVGRDCYGAPGQLSLSSRAEADAGDEHPPASFDVGGGWTGFAAARPGAGGRRPLPDHGRPRPARAAAVDVGMAGPRVARQVPHRGSRAVDPAGLHRAGLDLRAAVGLGAGQRPPPVAGVPRTRHSSWPGRRPAPEAADDADVGRRTSGHAPSPVRAPTTGPAVGGHFVADLRQRGAGRVSGRCRRRWSSCPRTWPRAGRPRSTAGPHRPRGGRRGPAWGSSSRPAATPWT